MIAIVVFIVLSILIYIFMYNSLVAKRNQVKNAFASIDTLLKKRYDLIPNLVNTVKQYMEHENETLTKIAQLRSRAVESSNIDEQAEIDSQMSGLMKSLMVQVENYPNLKANENFLKLQSSLNNIEGQIAAARRAYNAAVTNYNTSIQVFPNSVIASMANFTPFKLFEIPEKERQNVDVGNIFNS